MSFLVRGISNLIGIVMPIIHSFKVLKKPTKPKLIECIHYWTIYSIYLIIDWFLCVSFISYLIPFYDVITLFFICFLQFSPTFASILYGKFLAPFLRKNERKIDKISGKMIGMMPNLAMTTIPAVLESVVSVFNAPLMDVPQLEALLDDDAEDDVTDFPPSGPSSSRRIEMRRIIQVDRSFEIQDDIVEEDTNFTMIREIKEEIEDWEGYGVAPPTPATPRQTPQAPPTPVTPPQASPSEPTPRYSLRSRKPRRSNSAV